MHYPTNCLGCDEPFPALELTLGLCVDCMAWTIALAEARARASRGEASAALAGMGDWNLL